MAVTSIWRVKGWLGKVVVYIENPDKTTNPAYYEKADMTERECQELDDVIAYAVNSEKTQQANQEEEVVERFVSGVNCHPATARMEMMAVKKRFGKEEGTVAYHDSLTVPEIMVCCHNTSHNFRSRLPQKPHSPFPLGEPTVLCSQNG